MSRGFGSDNHSGAHPRILEAIARANEGHAPSYGTDEWTGKWNKLVSSVFGPEASSFFVFNGTAANVLAIGAFIKSVHTVLASDVSHLINDECGALENLTGGRVVSVPSALDGKINPESLRPFLIRAGDQHFSQPRLVSITQPTELGTLYSLQEIRALSDFCKTRGLILHIDGARLVNAAVALGCSLRELVQGADVVSLGGTKNGLLFGEAILFLNKKADPDFRYHRKQAMQLPSKTRLIASQFLEFIGTDLWRENAEHSLSMARLLSQGLRDLNLPSLVRVNRETQSNACFAVIDKRLIAKLREHTFFYVWDELTFECRLMTSWDTTKADIDRFLVRVRELANEL